MFTKKWNSRIKEGRKIYICDLLIGKGETKGNSKFVSNDFIKDMTKYNDYWQEFQDFQ
jgi:hypothetical protein